MDECKNRDTRPLEWQTRADIEASMSEREKQEFEKVMGDPSMPDYIGPDYEAWLFHKSYQARQTEIDALKDENELNLAANRGLGRLVDVLQVENERLRKDAERFEYLMDCIRGIRPHDGARGSGIYTWLLQIREPISVPTEGELMHSEIREAIDAAMTAPDTKGEWG